MRYDRPGCGLSERPRPAKWSLQLERDTLHSVMSAAGGTTFDLMGSSLGVPIAIDWAARNPETVNRLILYGGWARGADIATPQVREHVVGLVRSHWGLGSDVLTEIFAPDASAATSAELANYQRQASSAETAAELLLASYSVDVLEALGDITAPTLVLHRDRGPRRPFGTEPAHRVAHRRGTTGRTPRAIASSPYRRCRRPRRRDPTVSRASIPTTERGSHPHEEAEGGGATRQPGTHESGHRSAAGNRRALRRRSPRADSHQARGSLEGTGCRMVDSLAGRKLR